MPVLLTAPSADLDALYDRIEHRMGAGPALGREDVVTDTRRSSGAALKDLGSKDRQITGGKLDDQAENSPVPFRRRERATLRLWRLHSLRRFASVHSSVTNHFNSDCSLSFHPLDKQARTAARSEWRAPCADRDRAH